ncbi:hypothetical protein VTN02DRAFT_5953 [Thermoascus thermophilus]
MREILNDPLSLLATTDDGDPDDLQVRDTLVEGYRRGFRIMFIVMASLAALSFVLVIFLMPQLQLDRQDDKALKEQGKRELQEEAARKKGITIKKAEEAGGPTATETAGDSGATTPSGDANEKIDVIPAPAGEETGEKSAVQQQQPQQHDEKEASAVRG